MHPAEITAALRVRGSSQTKVAIEQSVDRSMISHIVYGRARTPRLRKAIARKIGKPISEIWPDPKVGGQ